MESPPQRCDITTVTLSTPLKEIMKNYYYLAALAVLGTVGTASASSATLQRTRLHDGVRHEQGLQKQVPTRSAENPETNCVATEANFYYDGEFMSGAGGYWLMLSSAGLDKSNPTHTGQLARLYILSEPDADPKHPHLPTGTFTAMPGDEFEAGYFAPDGTDFLDVFPNPDDPEAGLVCYSWNAKSGTITITEGENGVYTITADLDCISTADAEAENPDPEIVKCTASYTGEVPYVDYYAYIPITTDREVEITGVSGRYMEEEGIGIYSIAFYNVPLDDDGFIIGSGDLLNMECYVEATSKMELDKLCGTYTPVDALADGMIKGRFMEGVWYNIFGSVWGAFGTSLTEYLDDGSMLTGLCTDGTITVSKGENAEEYSVVFDLVTPENKTVKAKWSGRLGDYVADYAYDSIKGVADDGFSVTARGGSIEAPEGAEVFTISGMRVGRDNLPAGVYVVRHGGKSQKVIMK